MLTNPTTWYAGSRYVRVDQRGVKRDVLVPFHQPAQDAVGILADHERSRQTAPPRGMMPPHNFLPPTVGPVARPSSSNKSSRSEIAQRILAEQVLRVEKRYASQQLELQRLKEEVAKVVTLTA